MLEYSQVKAGEYSEMRKAGIALIVTGCVIGAPLIWVLINNLVTHSEVLISTIRGIGIGFSVVVVGYILKDKANKKDVKQ